MLTESFVCVSYNVCLFFIRIWNKYYEIDNRKYIILQSKTNFFYVNKINLLQLTGYVTHQQFNIQQLYALPTLYLWVLYLSENKQRLVPLTA